jgi:uncharacterized membrane protein (DUF4010 family)
VFSSDVAPFLYAAGIGLLIGIEREHSHTSRQAQGVRTFTLLCLLGALAAFVSPWVVGVGLAALAALLVVGYRRTSAEDPGTTTEIAALVTYLLGALAVSHGPLAAALGVLVALVLTTKARVHHVVRALLTEDEVEDLVRFLLIVFVVLPLLPNRAIGPYGALNPRHVGEIVVALSAISWAGYIATRVAGARRGLLMTGLAGGFISASATTAAMGRIARSAQATKPAMAAAIAASVATMVEMIVIVSVISPPIGVRLAVPLVAGAAALALTAWWELRGENPDEAVTNQWAARPFQLRPVLVLAALLTATILAARWLADVLGTQGAVVAAGAAGLADAHAGAIASASLHAKDTISISVALYGVSASLAANTVVKCVLAWIAGGAKFAVGFSLRMGLIGLGVVVAIIGVGALSA